MRILRGVLGACFGLWALCVILFGWLIGATACDDTCSPATGNWRDDQASIWWDVITVSGVTAGLAAMATMHFIWAGRSDAASFTWGLSAAASAAFGVTYAASLEPTTSAHPGGAVVLLVAGLLVGFGAVLASRASDGRAP